VKETTDVVVVGSGASGLTAALAATAAGAETVVLEAAAHWGGTTSVSGGVVWAPNNHRMAEIEAEDSVADALRYCRGQARGEPVLVEAFVRAASAMARFLECHAPIRFTPMRHPDTFAEAPGGKLGGRHLEVAPVEIAGACPEEQELGWPLSHRARLTNEEIAAWLSAAHRPSRGLAAQRQAAGQVTMGLGLVAGLLRGCRAGGVTLISRCRVRGLLRGDAGSVAGVQAVGADGRPWRLHARRGVVLATGGFEHDPGLVARLLGGAPSVPLSAPVSHGDGLRLAAAAGAELAHAGAGWRWPAAQVPGETWGDPAATPRPRMVVIERTLPHVIWINQAARRFVNEAAHNCALALDEVDPGTCRPRNAPAWAVGDARFRRSYPVAGVAPGQPSPEWLAQADTLADLAAQLGVDPTTMADTVSRFNRRAAAGHDDEFGRGQSAFERASGDARAPHPNLGGIEEPPFFALPIHSGVVGTKAGPRTDCQARVLGWGGAPIPGLYAAGNAMAAIFGGGTIANGLTLGTGLTWGWLAGRTAAGVAPDLR
jgi:succinate dehydrogenase/fumarate reductase flavoprotein subunit